MTDSNEVSLIEEVEASDAGAQGLAAADLAGQVARLLHSALVASDLDQKDLAAKLGVSPGRVSQVLNSDGNIRIAALARYLRAMGYQPTIAARPVDASVPELPERRRRRSPRKRASADRPSTTRPRDDAGLNLRSATDLPHAHAEWRSTAGFFKLVLHATAGENSATSGSVVDLARYRSQRRMPPASQKFDQYAVTLNPSPGHTKAGNA